MMATRGDAKKGPRIGDAASLWNFTPAPGWTKEEAQILKLCLMKFGVGQWLQIQNSGYLPGKLIQQLNGQTQRLLGQQSLAAYTGLKVDIDRIRTHNATITGKPRKSGLLIWDGPNPTKQMKQEWQREAKEKWGLTEQDLAEVDRQLEALTSARASANSAPQHEPAAVALPVDKAISSQSHSSLLDSDPNQLSHEMKLQLLHRLQRALHTLLVRVADKAPELMPEGLKLPPTPKIDQLTQHQVAERPAVAAGMAHIDDLKNISGMSQLNQARWPHTTGAHAGVKRSRSNKTVRNRRGTGKSISKELKKPEDPDLQMTSRRPGSRPSKLRSIAEAGYGESNLEGEQATEGAQDTVQAALEVGLQDLMELGFDRSKAKVALTECQFDVERAVDWLFANCS